MTGQDFPRVITIDANVLVAYSAKSHTTERYRRLAHLFGQAEKAKSKLIIPMPALAEYLVRADQAALAVLERLERKTFIVVAPFDRAAAFECSQLDASAIGRGDKRDGQQDAWQKIKIDRQIVAIGKTHGAQWYISDDDGVRATAMRIGVRSSKVAELPLPVTQGELKLPK
jgi:hypothetical protein